MNGDSGNGICVETTVRALDAVSPAFEIEGNMFLPCCYYSCMK